MHLCAMVDGPEFWFSCQQLKLRKASHFKQIQNLTPSTIVLQQCDIRIETFFAHKVDILTSQLEINMLLHRTLNSNIKRILA